MSKEIEKKQTFADFLNQYKSEIEKALPKHLDPEKMIRIATTEYRTVKDLKKCTPASIIGSIIRCSQLGLMPGSDLGHAWLVPYRNYRENVYECQLIVGYRGMINLAWQSEKIVSCHGSVVYENDEFDFMLGTGNYLHHKPTNPENRGKIIGAYFCVDLIKNAQQFDFIYKEDIEKIRQRSKARDNGPWVTDYEMMAVKTVVRRLFKFLPISTELQRAITLDEAADRGEQNNSAIFEGEYEQKNGNGNGSRAENLADEL